MDFGPILKMQNYKNTQKAHRSHPYDHDIEDKFCTQNKKNAFEKLKGGRVYGSELL